MELPPAESMQFARLAIAISEIGMNDDMVVALIEKYHTGALITPMAESMIVCLMNPSNASRFMEGGLPAGITDTLIRWAVAPSMKSPHCTDGSEPAVEFLAGLQAIADWLKSRPQEYSRAVKLREDYQAHGMMI